MKNYITIYAILFCVLSSVAQQTYTLTKGPKFLPGHYHAVITVDSSAIHYQLFNHWYSSSYNQNRDLKISLSDIAKYNKTNDTLQILVLENRIKLIDKRFKIKKKVKHETLCASVDIMRKIAYASKVAAKHQTVKHYDLFNKEDLALSEPAFKKLVDEKVKKLLRSLN